MATMVNAKITSLMKTLVNTMTLLTYMLKGLQSCKNIHLPWQLT